MATRLWGTIPLFHGTEGRSGTLEAWQRRDMFVAVLDPAGCPACDGLREALERDAARRGAEQVHLAVVGRGDPAQDPGEVSGSIGRAVGTEGAVLVVVDRFGRLYAAVDVHSRDAGAALGEAWSWMDFLRSQCEECGAPLDW